MYSASFIILPYDQQMHNYFTNMIICEIIVHLLVIVQKKIRKYSVCASLQTHCSCITNKTGQCCLL